MFRPNSLFYSDGYKIGHFRMLAPGTIRLYGTWIPRSVKHTAKYIKKIVSIGQQLTVRWLHDEFKENFFALSEEEALKFAKDMSKYLGLEYDAEHFRDLHRLGYLPIRIKSLPEGIETDPNIPHMTFINTVDGFAWLTLYLETIISSLSWKTSNSATIALKYKRNVMEWVKKTDIAQSFLIPFMCHDFSARGLSPWDMLSSGIGHASSFRGSDTLIVIPGARYFYNEPEDDVCINSVNASEHSVSTTCIFTMGESAMIKYFMDQFPIGILSIVADTFDLWELITKYLVDNKEQIMSRDGKLVIRPDSGDPVDIICGVNSNIPYFASSEDANDFFVDLEFQNNKQLFEIENTYYQVRADDVKEFIRDYGFDNYSQIRTDVEKLLQNGLIEEVIHVEQPSNKGVIELLWDIFGGTINEQGYKVLDPHVGVIYGDSITLDRQVAIYERLAAKGFAATNIVLGVGSFTYQYNTRDTLGWAAKGAWFEIMEKAERKSYNIYKDPVTDDGTKKSLKGFCQVFNNRPDARPDQLLYDGKDNIEVITECTEEQEQGGLLHIIYEDGNFYNQTTLTEIRRKLDLIA